MKVEELSQRTALPGRRCAVSDVRVADRVETERMRYHISSGGGIVKVGRASRVLSSAF